MYPLMKFIWNPDLRPRTDLQLPPGGSSVEQNGMFCRGTCYAKETVLKSVDSFYEGQPLFMLQQMLGGYHGSAPS